MLRTMQTINADTGKRKNVEPYEELANGIILQAVDDYKALKCGRIPTITEEAQLNMKKSMVFNIIADQKREIINFFNSQWFSILTSLKPKLLIDHLNSLQYEHWKPTFKYVPFNCAKFTQLTKNMETAEIQSKIMETSKRKMSKDVINRLKRVKHRMVKLSTVRALEKALNLAENELIAGKTDNLDEQEKREKIIEVYSKNKDLPYKEIAKIVGSAPAYVGKVLRQIGVKRKKKN